MHFVRELITFLKKYSCEYSSEQPRNLLILGAKLIPWLLWLFLCVGLQTQPGTLAVLGCCGSTAAFRDSWWNSAASAPDSPQALQLSEAPQQPWESLWFCCWPCTPKSICNRDNTIPDSDMWVQTGALYFEQQRADWEGTVQWRLIPCCKEH